MSANFLRWWFLLRIILNSNFTRHIYEPLSSYANTPIQLVEWYFQKEKVCIHQIRHQAIEANAHDVSFRVSVAIRIIKGFPAYDVIFGNRLSGNQELEVHNITIGSTKNVNKKYISREHFHEWRHLQKLWWIWSLCSLMSEHVNFPLSMYYLEFEDDGMPTLVISIISVYVWCVTCELYCRISGLFYDHYTFYL